MRKLLFSLIVVVTFGFTGNAQTSFKEWNTMMVKHKSIVDIVLRSECPEGLELVNFKHQVIEGKIKLSEKSTSEILKSSEPLKKYAQEFIKKNNILVDSEDELLFYATFYPNFPMNDDLNQTFGGPGLTADEIWDCAVDAVGLGFVTAIGAAGIKAAGIKVFTKALTKFITKFAGPIGAAITAADFGFCLYGQSLD